VEGQIVAWGCAAAAAAPPARTTASIPHQTSVLVVEIHTGHPVLAAECYPEASTTTLGSSAQPRCSPAATPHPRSSPPPFNAGSVAPPPPAAAASSSSNMDPVIKRVFVDTAVPLPAKSIRLASTIGFLAFLGATLYAKHVSPQQMQAEIARDMYSKTA